MRTHLASTASNGMLGAVPAAAGDLMHRTADAVMQEAHALSERTGRYVRDEPAKSIALAAALGAVLTGLVALALWRTR